MVGMDGVTTVVGENKLFLEKPFQKSNLWIFCRFGYDFENIFKYVEGTNKSQKYHNMLLS